MVCCDDFMRHAAIRWSALVNSGRACRVDAGVVGEKMARKVEARSVRGAEKKVGGLAAGVEEEGGGGVEGDGEWE